MSTPVKPTFPMSVVKWLRAGYPQGIPPKDRIPLVALLARKLTAEQIAEVAVELAESRAELADPNAAAAHITEAEIASHIADLTRTVPSEVDVIRVGRVLAAAGWPLADEHRLATGFGPDETSVADAAAEAETDAAAPDPSP